jgi:hypothetical protein
MCIFGTLININVITFLRVSSVRFEVFTAASNFRATEFSSGVGNLLTQSREEGGVMFLRNGVTSMLNTRIFIQKTII